MACPITSASPVRTSPARPSWCRGAWISLPDRVPPEWKPRGGSRYAAGLFQSIEPRFYLTGLVPTDDEVYAGPATVSLAGVDITAHANLAGHLDPIDGRYHWRGSFSGDLPDDVLKGQRAVSLSIDRHRVEARFVERTPWGGYTVTGVGAPPFALSE